MSAPDNNLERCLTLKEQLRLYTAVESRGTSASAMMRPEHETAESDAIIECADNLEFMRCLINDSMKLIVTSPPYNLGKAYERRKALDTYLSSQTQVISECVRLLHPQGSICWQVGNHIAKDGEVVPLDTVLYPVFKSHGLRLRNRIIWHFGHGLHCSKRFSGRYETILWFTKGDDYTFNLHLIRSPSKEVS